MYQRCMFGSHDLVLKEVDPSLVEHAFGRIKILNGQAVTVVDEPFVSEAVENYNSAIGRPREEWRQEVRVIILQVSVFCRCTSRDVTVSLLHILPSILTS